MALKFTTVKTLQISDGVEKITITRDDAQRVLAELAPMLAEERLRIDNECYPRGDNAVSIFERHFAILIASGLKIEAIKLHREQFRSGLKEAKDAVEELEEQMFPGYFRMRKAQRKAAKEAIVKDSLSEWGKKADVPTDDNS